MPSSLPTREEVEVTLPIEAARFAYGRCAGYAMSASLAQAEAQTSVQFTTEAVQAADALWAALNPEPVPEEARQAEAPKGETETGEGDLDAAANAFWASFREHLSVEACEAVEHEGIHPKDWAAAAECCIRAARGERDCRPFTTYPDLPRDAPPSVPVFTERPDGETEAVRLALGLREHEWIGPGGRPPFDWQRLAEIATQAILTHREAQR